MAIALAISWLRIVHCTYNQCDQTLKYEVAEIIQNLPKKQPRLYTHENGYIQKAQNVLPFGLLLQENLPQKTFKNCPIWSHCLQSILRHRKQEKDQECYFIFKKVFRERYFEIAAVMKLQLKKCHFKRLTRSKV